MRVHNGWATVAMVLCLAGCVTPGASVHRNVGNAAAQPLPHKILLLPTDIRVHEISTGGVVEKVDDWTKAASDHATAYARKLGSRGAFEVVEQPELSKEHQALLEQHAALYELVSASADLARESPFAAWQERAKQFDYTIGPGLKDVAQQSGIDAALVISGTDYISSAGRKAAMAMGVIAGLLTGVVILPSGGQSFLSVGVVDMRTGELIWYNTDRSGVTDLRDDASMKTTLDKLFATYPAFAAKAPTK